MSKREEKGLIPELRFPEFRDEGDWIPKKFGDICKFVRGPFGGALKKEIFVSEGYPVYEQTHAIYQNFDSFRYYIDNKKFNELGRFEVKPGDIIMSCSGTMGKFAVIPLDAKRGVINQALLKLTVNDTYDLKFIKYTLEYPPNQEKLLSQSAGGAIKNVVGVAQLKKIEIPITRLKEQQKIADCLSSIDENITAQTEKLEALKNHKKGLMQQLFPSPGGVSASADGVVATKPETTPKLRFPEFRDGEDWEIGHISDMAKITKGKAIKSKDLIHGKYPVVAGGKTSPYNSLTFTHEDVVTISASGAYAGYVSYHPYKIWASDCSVVTTQNHSIKYIFHMLSHLQKKIYSLQIGGAQPHVYPKELEILEIRIPPLKEQQKIAACLSSIDDLITIQTKKLNTLKNHKKGLMQKLFPSSGGVAGVA